MLPSLREGCFFIGDLLVELVEKCGQTVVTAGKSEVGVAVEAVCVEKLDQTVVQPALADFDEIDAPLDENDVRGLVKVEGLADKPPFGAWVEVWMMEMRLVPVAQLGGIVGREENGAQHLARGVGISAFTEGN